MDPLTKLADKYGTTKGSKAHLYTPFYHRLLEPRRMQVKKILEIGIENFCSHRMWKDYFPNAEIFGMDFVPKPENYGVKVFTGNQANRDHLAAMIQKFGGDFDLIVDDGGHQMSVQQISLGCLFPCLKHNGIYIIEDLFTCLWGVICGVKPDGSNSTLKFLEAIQRNDKQWISEYMTQAELQYLHTWAHVLEIYERQTEMISVGCPVPYNRHITAALTKLPC